MHISRIVVAVLAAVQTLAAQAPPSLQPQPKSIDIPRIDAQITVDGALDEPAWRQAARLAPFVLNETTQPARGMTDVRAWYDAAALYLGWLCDDVDIQSTFTKRDSRFWEEEVAEFFVTPSALDKYFELQWNPLGGTFDAIITNTLGTDGLSQKISGDWSYTAAGMTFAVRADGTVQNSSDRDRRWTVEVRIPFSDFNVPAPQPGDVWRGNFYRFNRDSGAGVEQLSWSPTRLPNFHQPSRFGYLRFR